MQKQFLAIIAVCLALTGCVKDVANLVLPIDETTDLAKSASYKMAGECGNLCGGFEWKTATTSDLQAELNAGAAVNGRDEDGTTPLHKAAWFGKPAHIKMLVGAGADLNAKNRWGDKPLHWAAEHGTPANIEALIDAGADINGTKYNSPLRAAIEVDMLYDRENWKLLVRAGANVNIFIHNCGDTLLHEVAENGTSADVIFLLKAGANPNLKHRRNWGCDKLKTPLELASQNSRLKGTKAFYALSDATYK